MELALITAQQVLILFILIAVGTICVKIGVLKMEWKNAFSNLLIYLVVPAMVLTSYFEEFDEERFANLLQAFGLGGALMSIGLIISLLIGIKGKSKDWQVARFACTFSNAGYMGFPLILALYGTEGVFYASAFLTIFNIFLWTVGVVIMTGKVKAKDVIHNVCSTPAILTVVLGLLIYMLRIPVPQVIKSPVEMIGGMNTAISMIITGMIIAGTDFKELMKNHLLFLIIGVRMFLIPVFCIVLFVILGIRGEVATIVLLLEACPTAAITSVFAVKYGHNENLAAGAVVCTTLLSIITLPFCALLLAMLF